MLGLNGTAQLAVAPAARRLDLVRPVDGLIALGLAALALLADLPFRTQMLYAWDSVLYIYALDDFNVGAHHPQPPGYLFYVLSAYLVRALTGLPGNEAFVWISALAASGTVAVLYLAGRSLFDRVVGLTAAALALTSVAFSVYAGVAYPYTVLALGSSLLGWLAWRVRVVERVAAWPLGLALGLAAGFRQDLLVLLGPLVLVSVGWQSRRRLAGALLAGALASLLWLAPSAILSEGLPSYIAALTAQTARVARDTSVAAQGLAGLVTNVHYLARYSANTLYLALLPLALAVGVALGTAAGRRDRRTWHLALWAAPAVLVYALVHLGDIGYVFSFMPAAWLAAAAGLALAAGWLADRLDRPAWRPALLALLAAVPVGFNLWWSLLSPLPLSATWLTCKDRALADAVARVQADYPPATTALVTSGYYQQARYYLPGYRIWFQNPYRTRVLRQPVPPGITQVILFDWLLEAQLHERLTMVPLLCDYPLPVFAVEPGDVIVVRPPTVELTQ